jgi:hypothetical protein
VGQHQKVWSFIDEGVEEAGQNSSAVATCYTRCERPTRPSATSWHTELQKSNYFDVVQTLALLKNVYKQGRVSGHMVSIFSGYLY